LAFLLLSIVLNKEVLYAKAEIKSGKMDIAFHEIRNRCTDECGPAMQSVYFTRHLVKPKEKEKKDKKFHRVERFYGSFMRCFTLPVNVDETKIEASFKDGMLNLTVPKTEAAKPKTIDVKIR